MNNNMKLYTEEQVIKAINLAQECDSDCGGVYFDYENPNYILDELTHIELPSDEEIDKQAKNINTDGFLSWEVDLAMEQFNSGAKWIIKQIKQQDNG